MKNLKIALIIVLILLVALPLFGQRRGRRRARMKAAPVTLSLYFGLEDLTEALPEEKMYYRIGGDVILPIVEPVMLRVSLINFDLHEDFNIFNIGTAFGGDIMYYWQVPMAFIPYGFGGLNYYNYSNGGSYSSLALHLGVGGQMRSFFLEFGFDLYQFSNGDSESYSPMFIHAGMRFPLFR